MSAFDVRDAAPALDALLARGCVTEIRIAREQPLLGVARGGATTWFPGATLAEAALRAVHALSPRAVTSDPEDLP